MFCTEPHTSQQSGHRACRLVNLIVLNPLRMSWNFRFIRSRSWCISISKRAQIDNESRYDISYCTSTELESCRIWNGSIDICFNESKVLKSMPLKLLLIECFSKVVL